MNREELERGCPVCRAKVAFSDEETIHYAGTCSGIWSRYVDTEGNERWKNDELCEDALQTVQKLREENERLKKEYEIANGACEGS